jgi:tripartite ATP-independent transporter DctP family solute receptor
MGRGKSVIAALCCFVAASAWLSPAIAQLKPKFHTNATVGHPLHVALNKFTETVRARTGGKVDFAIFPALQLGAEAEAAEKIKLGAIEAGTITSSVFSSWIPDVEVIDLPFLFRDDDHVLASYGFLTKTLAPKFEAQGFHLVGFTISGSRHLISTFPIKTPEDVVGKKMRVIQNPIHVNTWKLLGANPTPLPAPEIYNGLQTRVIDYFDFAKSFYFSFRFYEVAKHFTELGHIYALNAWVVSNSYWKRLDASQRRAIEDAAAETFPSLHKTTIELDEQGLTKALQTNTGVQVIRITDKAPWRQKMEPIWSTYIGQNAERRKLVDAIVAIKR